MLQELRSRTCLGAVAQPETGGDILLHFGGWQSYEELPHPRLLVTERGKWSLMLRCPWRLDDGTSVVCDWRAVADRERETEQPYVAFEGLRVDSVELVKPALDLILCFSHGFRLVTSCGSSRMTDDCWYLLRPDGSSVAATRAFQLVFSPQGSTEVLR
jgi:hypothetical protein